MASPTTSAVKRLARNSVALGLTTFLAGVFKLPQLIWLTPVINAVAKAIRDKFGIKYMPL
jgi:hypothetical protein